MNRKKRILLLLTVITLLIVPFITVSAGTVQLPQTGQTKCYDTAGTEIACAGTGQDGDIRAGVAWPSPRFTDNGDGTVTDNLTGLMWTKDANLAGQKRWQQALDYVAAMNSGSGTYGYADWRLPNVNELESLSNCDEPNPAVWLNTQGFSNVQSNPYWSSSTLAHFTGDAWYIGMGSGRTNTVNKTYKWYVWPVRSTLSGTIHLPQTGETKCYNTSSIEIACAGTGQDGEIQAGVVWPAPRFTDNIDGTVTDELTGLIWTKDANLPAVKKTWQDALDYVAAMNVGAGSFGYTDWRLPNRKELKSLADFSIYGPAMSIGAPFINVQSKPYWSSSTYTYAGSTNTAWYVTMGKGGVENYDKSNLEYVWPVRSGITGTTAITLSTFKAKQRGKKVLIKWKTASEINNLGFNILRSDSESEEYRQVNKKLIPAKQNAVSGAKYKFKDRNVKKGNYFYELEDIDKTTGSTVHDAVEVNVKGKAFKRKRKK